MGKISEFGNFIVREIKVLDEIVKILEVYQVGFLVFRNSSSFGQIKLSFVGSKYYLQLFFFFLSLFEDMGKQTQVEI